MFKITLSPHNSEAILSMEKVGETLIINSTEFDFSDMPEGGEYPPEALDHPSIEGGVKKDGGVISIAIRLPYTNPEPPRSVAFPEPLMVIADGVVELPEGRFYDVDQ